MLSDENFRFEVIRAPTTPSRPEGPLSGKGDVSLGIRSVAIIDLSMTVKQPAAIYHQAGIGIR